MVRLELKINSRCQSNLLQSLYSIFKQQEYKFSYLWCEISKEAELKQFNACSEHLGVHVNVFLRD